MSARELHLPFSLVKLRSIAMCTSLFSAAVQRSVLGMLAAFSSQRRLLKVKTTTGRSSFFLRRPMR